MKPNQSPLNRM